MSLAQAVIDLAVEGFDLAVQHAIHVTKVWWHGGDLAEMDSFADPYVTRVPETDDELRERFKVARRAVSP